MTSEERIQRGMAPSFYPYGNVPGPDYDFTDYADYVDHLVVNLGGPLRIFRAAMLDLVSMICVNPEQKKAARDVVFSKFKENAELLEAWCRFYGFDDETVLCAIKGLD
jgi:hypothetical protein